MILGNKIIKIVSIDPDSYSVRLEFSDGEQGTVSLRHLFENPKGMVTEILKGNFFAKCFILNGALAWPNGFELCPDALRMKSDLNLKKHSA